MSNMKIELYGRNAELCSFTGEDSSSLILSFDSEHNGYISLGPITARISGKECAVDIRRLCDGEYTPHLILADMTVDLPRIKIIHGIPAPIQPGKRTINDISLRERRLSVRVDLLEQRVEELTKKIVGTSLFRAEP